MSGYPLEQHAAKPKPQRVLPSTLALLSLGLGLGWWQEHRAHRETAADIEALKQWGNDANEAFYERGKQLEDLKEAYSQLQREYEKFVPPAALPDNPFG